MVDALFTSIWNIGEPGDMPQENFDMLLVVYHSIIITLD